MQTIKDYSCTILGSICTLIFVVVLMIFYLEWSFRLYLEDTVHEAARAFYADEFSSKLRVATFYMEKEGHTRGTCEPAYEELRQIYYDSGELLPTSTIQEFQNLKVRLEHWQLPPMFCGGE